MWSSCSITLTVALIILVEVQPTLTANWTNWGGNLKNTHYAESETIVKRCNVQHLTEKWNITTDWDVSAIPTFKDGKIYFPDWKGWLYAVDAEDGSLEWKINLGNITGKKGVITYFGYNGTASRNSPLLVGQYVIVSDVSSGTVFAFRSSDGSLMWSKLVESHPAARGTSSPTHYNGIVYVGMSSNEEQLAALVPGYQCCTFRGSLTALDLETGNILWKTYTVPDNFGQPNRFSGGAVWGSSPSIDTGLQLIYFNTGNNYQVPSYITQCQLNNFTNCSPCDNHVDSIIAADLESGEVVWSKNFAGQSGIDAWNLACRVNPYNNPNCPTIVGDDFGFGQSPMLFQITKNGKRIKAVGASSKNGYFVTLERRTGKLLWSTYIGPGGTMGGLQWGSAVDETKIYVALANNGGLNYTINGQTVWGGSWAALDKNTGQILWQTADPQSFNYPPSTPQLGLAMGPVTVANGVLFAGSMAPTGNNYYALNGETGSILWSFASGGSVNTAPTVVNGSVYWGSGYQSLGLFTTNNVFRAFHIPAHYRGCI